MNNEELIELLNTLIKQNEKLLENKENSELVKEYLTGKIEAYKIVLGLVFLVK